MPRPPSKHGLEKKYKSWRKGKGKKQYDDMGEKKLSGSSLKNRLRSQKRLLSKLEVSPSNASSREKIEASIKDLETRIADREHAERERKNAHKYHQIKFFERQKLTRLERKVNKSLIEAKSAADFDDITKFEDQLERIALDQLYVAFYPNRTKYISLFAENSKGRNDILCQVDEKTRQKQIVIRQRILDRIQQEGDGFIQENLKKKSWVNLKFLVKRGILDKGYSFEEAFKKGCDIYKVQGDTVEMERNIARKRELQKQMDKEIKQRNDKLLSIDHKTTEKTGIVERKEIVSHVDDSDSGELSNYSRSLSNDNSVDRQREKLNHSKLTKFVSDDKTSNDKKDTCSSSDSDSDTSSSSDSDSDTSSSSDSDSDTSSSSDSDSDTSSSSDSDSDTSSSSDSSSDSIVGNSNNNSKGNGEINHSNPERDSKVSGDDESDDDFLVAIDEKRPENVFAKAFDIKGDEKFIGKRGDKSKGWTTQKQRPGDWKKKRQRR